MHASVDATPSSSRFAWAPWAALALLTLLGTYLRLAHIGDRGIPADELEMWRICKLSTSWWDILCGDVKGVPTYPLLPAYLKGMQQLFGWEPTPYALRFPVALLGILCIPLMFVCGRRLYGAWGGVLCAALITISPVHIQCSTEAYPYIVSTLGFCLALGVLLATWDAARAGRGPAVITYVGFGLATVLLTYSNISAWPFGGLFFAAFIGQRLLACRGNRRAWIGVLVAVAVVLIVMGPAAWVNIKDWIARGSMTFPQASYIKGGARLLDPEGFTFIFNFGWGRTPLRAALTLIILLFTAIACWHRRRDARTWLLVVLLVLGVIATMFSCNAMGHPFITRLLIPIMPAYYLLIAGGILLGFAAIWRQAWPSSARIVAGVACGLCLVAPLAGPASLAYQLEGTAVPFLRLNQWLDATFRPGTPVLCDRYFTAYNEFVVNAPTNVVFMSTIPNEPMQRFEGENWRGTAVEFFQNNPDAVFYEDKMFWEFFGPWEWPHEHFARKKAFVDTRSTTLARLGMAYRQPPPGRNEAYLARMIYYNTEDDVIAAGRADGKRALALYGDGWPYVKTTDYRDWRMLGQKATLRVFNLGDTPYEARLLVYALAAGGDKAVDVASYGQVTFPGNRGVRMAIGPVRLAPGLNVVTLTDAGSAAAQIPLLVQKVEVDTVTPDLAGQPASP